MRSVLAGLRNLVLPWGAPSTSPRMVLGPDIPAELRNASGDFTWYAAQLWYYGSGSDFYFEGLATNTVFGVQEHISGTCVAGVVTFYEFAEGAGSGDYPAVKWGTDSYNGARRVKLVVRQSDIMITTTGTLKAEDPVLDDGTLETWHGLPYVNGWANNAAPNLQPLRYRKDALGRVQIVGAAFSPNPFNSVMGTLPAAYRPPKDVSVWAWTGGANAQLLQVTIAGVVQVFGDTTVNRTWWINGSFPLDIT